MTLSGGIQEIWYPTVGFTMWCISYWCQATILRKSKNMMEYHQFHGSIAMGVKLNFGLITWRVLKVSSTLRPIARLLMVECWITPSLSMMNSPRNAIPCQIIQLTHNGFTFYLPHVENKLRGKGWNLMLRNMRLSRLYLGYFIICNMKKMHNFTWSGIKTL